VNTTLEIIEGPDPTRDESGWEHYAYVLRLKRNGHTLTTPWKQGVGITSDPNPEDVLECLVNEAQTLEYSTGFEGWALELGFDADSRAAEKVYRQVVAQTRKLRRFLGRDFDAILEGDSGENAHWLVNA
jgi:hypothetical protein